MFQAARSLSLTAWPKRGLSGSARTGCGPVAPSGIPSAVLAAMPPLDVLPPMLLQPTMASAAAARANLNLADGIAHLPIRVDRPRLDRVIVLHETDDRARLAQVADARLHVAI